MQLANGAMLFCNAASRNPVQIVPMLTTIIGQGATARKNTKFLTRNGLIMMPFITNPKKRKPKKKRMIPVGQSAARPLMLTQKAVLKSGERNIVIDRTIKTQQPLHMQGLFCMLNSLLTKRLPHPSILRFFCAHLSCVFLMVQNFTQFMGGLIGGNTTPSGNTASRLCTVVETRRPLSGTIN